MAQSQFVPRAKLFTQLQEIISLQESGLLTILTDTDRSIFLRFSQGRLTRVHCRSGEAGEAIQMLAESAMVKYSYAVAPVDDEPELMPADSFLQLIDPGGNADSKDPAATIVSSVDPSVSDPVKAQMLDIATDYMGVVAEMIVEEAFDGNSDVGQAIEYIGNAIPDTNQSSAFRESALEHFSSIKF